MSHFATADKSQSVCTEFEEFDVMQAGDDTGPTDYCGACREAEPTWEILTEEEFLKRWPL